MYLAQPCQRKLFTGKSIQKQQVRNTFLNFYINLQFKSLSGRGYAVISRYIAKTGEWQQR